MKLLISEKLDKVTDYVVEWLVANKQTFCRVDNTTLSTLRSINLTNQHSPSTNFEFNEQSVESSQLSGVWHRRARINFVAPEMQGSLFKEDLIEDQKKVNYFIEASLRDSCHYVGSYIREVENNKLVELENARKAGLNIPETLVTGRKMDLLPFVERFGSVVTKQLFSPFCKNDGQFQYCNNGTTKLSVEEVKQFPAEFSISLFQEYIEKEIEIRVFFFKDLFFGMGIFSQKDPKTAIDFRNYNDDSPNRNVPVRLTENVIQCLRCCVSGRYETGSIDLILTPKNEYYFLEINPSGQFHWLSQNCNYYIEKQIAQNL